MSLYGFSVKKPITVLMITLVVIIIGIVSLTRIPLDLFPKIEVPVAVVSTTYEGAGPEEVESIVTKPIEGAIATVSNVKEISSISQESSSLIIAEFNSGTDMNFAALEMREKIDLIKGFLPSSIKTPMVMKLDPNALPIMEISLYSEDDLSRLESQVKDTIIPKIEGIEGVANVSLTGGREKEVAVVVDEMKAASYGLNLDTIAKLIGAENLNMPAGQVNKGDKELTLKTIGEFKSIDDIKSIPIPLTTGGVIHLQDVADVSIENKEVSTLSRVNGKKSLNMSIQKQSGANTVMVSNKIHKELGKILKDYPNIEKEIVLDQAEYIKLSIRNVLKNALIGAALAVFVLYLFLRDIKTTLIISVSIPISIIATFILLYFGNITINMMTLGGIALGVGMLVDNSIVVLENIYRFSEEGLPAERAAVEGAREVSIAVVASTLTTIAVFFPIVFVKGITATIFKELALTVTFSLLMSLIVALTVIPMLSSKSLKHKKEKKKDVFNRTYAKFETLYSRLLNWGLGHKGLAVLIAVVIFIGTMAPTFYLGGELFPPIDEGVFTINAKLPEGASYLETNDIIRTIEEKIKDIKEIDTIFASVGTGGGSNTNKGSIVVTLVDKKDRQRSTFQVADEVRKIREDIPGAEISVDVASDMMAGLGGDPVNITIKGEDLDTLKKIAEDFKEIVQSTEGTREVKLSYEEGVPEIKVDFDRDLLSQYGLTTFQAAGIIRGSISGTTASRYKYEGTEIDIVVKGDGTFKESLDYLKSLPLPTPLGTTIPLGEVANITMENSPSTIKRLNQSRTISVTSQILNRDVESVIDDIDQVLRDYPMPHGYSFTYEGQHKQLREAYSDLTLAMILAIVFVFLILASQFESFKYPFIIILSIPLAFSGGALGLLLTGNTLSVPAIVGWLILSGIVVNNAIVLVDYINTLRKEGMSREEAILKAGPTRLRPILMTTLTTILGLLPMAIGKGEGAELQSPMAITLIGGLILSTLLTLVFIPVMYTIIDNIGSRKRAGEE
jgi:HAE1 family hydrophobic/amphiphilic exporter-1